MIPEMRNPESRNPYLCKLGIAENTSYEQYYSDYKISQQRKYNETYRRSYKRNHNYKNYRRFKKGHRQRHCVNFEGHLILDLRSMSFQ